MPPLATVVTLIDFEVGTERAWSDLRRTLRGLARQDFQEPFEVILLEDENLSDRIPDDLTQILPSLRVELSPKSLQYDLKSEAARVGTSDLVILLDADCEPVPSWLRLLIETMRRHPEVGVVSGKTKYAGRTFLERACGVLGRAYVDRTGAGEIKHISNNNAAFRREVLKNHPLPTRAGPFSSKLHAEAIMRDGWKLWVEPEAGVTHAFDGWSMEKDIRRHTGYAIVTVRQLDPQLSHSWMVRFRYLSIPIIVTARVAESWIRVLRFFRTYGLRWYEVPLVLGLSIVLHLEEIPGMICAFQGHPITETAYR